jgi:hypothetical protein
MSSFVIVLHMMTILAAATGVEGAIRIQGNILRMHVSLLIRYCLLKKDN